MDTGMTETVETIAGMDAVLAIATPSQWAKPARLAANAAPFAAERLGCSEEEAEQRLLRYIVALGRGAESDDDEPRKYPRYNHAAIVADAYASAAAGLDGRTACSMSAGEYGFDATR
jgi:hypothetical protein